MKSVRCSISLILLIGVFVMRAHGQDAFDGKWKATFEGPRTFRDATVTISNTGGSWRDNVHWLQRSDPCLGRQFPLKFRTRSATRISFDVDGPAGLAGCPVMHVTASVVDNKTLVGKMGNGKPIKMVRE